MRSSCMSAVNSATPSHTVPPTMWSQRVWPRSDIIMEGEGLALDTSHNRRNSPLISSTPKSGGGGNGVNPLRSYLQTKVGAKMVQQRFDPQGGGAGRGEQNQQQEQQHQQSNHNSAVEEALSPSGQRKPCESCSLDSEPGSSLLDSFMEKTDQDLFQQCREHLDAISQCTQLQQTINDEMRCQAELHKEIYQQMELKSQRLETQAGISESNKEQAWVNNAFDDLRKCVTYQAHAHRVYSHTLLNQSTAIQQSLDSHRDLLERTKHEPPVLDMTARTGMSFVQATCVFEGVRKPRMKLISEMDYLNTQVKSLEQQLDNMKRTMDDLRETGDHDQVAWRLQLKMEETRTKHDFLSSRHAQLDGELRTAAMELKDFHLRHRDKMVEVVDVFRQHRLRCDSTLKKSFSLLLAASRADAKVVAKLGALRETWKSPEPDHSKESSEQPFSSCDQKQSKAETTTTNASSGCAVSDRSSSSLLKKQSTENRNPLKARKVCFGGTHYSDSGGKVGKGPKSDDDVSSNHSSPGVQPQDVVVTDSECGENKRHKLAVEDTEVRSSQNGLSIEGKAVELKDKKKENARSRSATPSPSKGRLAQGTLDGKGDFNATIKCKTKKQTGLRSPTKGEMRLALKRLVKMKEENVIDGNNQTILKPNAVETGEKMSQSDDQHQHKLSDFRDTSERKSPSFRDESDGQSELKKKEGIEIMNSEQSSLYSPTRSRNSHDVVEELGESQPILQSDVGEIIVPDARIVLTTTPNKQVSGIKYRPNLGSKTSSKRLRARSHGNDQTSNSGNTSSSASDDSEASDDLGGDVNREVHHGRAEKHKSSHRTAGGASPSRRSAGQRSEQESGWSGDASSTSGRRRVAFSDVSMDSHRSSARSYARTSSVSNSSTTGILKNKTPDSTAKKTTIIREDKIMISRVRSEQRRTAADYPRSNDHRRQPKHEQQAIAPARHSSGVFIPEVTDDGQSDTSSSTDHTFLIQGAPSRGQGSDDQVNEALIEKTRLEIEEEDRLNRLIKKYANTRTGGSLLGKNFNNFNNSETVSCDKLGNISLLGQKDNVSVEGGQADRLEFDTESRLDGGGLRTLSTALVTGSRQLKICAVRPISTDPEDCQKQLSKCGISQNLQKPQTDPQLVSRLKQFEVTAGQFVTRSENSLDLTRTLHSLEETGPEQTDCQDRVCRWSAQRYSDSQEDVNNNLSSEPNRDVHSQMPFSNACIDTSSKRTCQSWVSGRPSESETGKVTTASDFVLNTSPQVYPFPSHHEPNISIGLPQGTYSALTTGNTQHTFYSFHRPNRQWPHTSRQQCDSIQREDSSIEKTGYRDADSTFPEDEDANYPVNSVKHSIRDPRQLNNLDIRKLSYTDDIRRFQKPLKSCLKKRTHTAKSVCWASELTDSKNMNEVLFVNNSLATITKPRGSEASDFRLNSPHQYQDLLLSQDHWPQQEHECTSREPESSHATRVQPDTHQNHLHFRQTIQVLQTNLNKTHSANSLDKQQTNSSNNNNINENSSVYSHFHYYSHRVHGQLMSRLSIFSEEIVETSGRVRRKELVLSQEISTCFFDLLRAP